MQTSDAVVHAFCDTFNRITCAVAMQACVVLGWQTDQTRFTRIFFFRVSFAHDCVNAALDLSDDCDVAGASRHHRQAALIPKDVQTLKRANLQKATDVAMSRGITSHSYSCCLHSNFSYRKCGENLSALTYE